jgi:hypothetical protein
MMSTILIIKSAKSTETFEFSFLYFKSSHALWIRLEIKLNYNVNETF